MPPQNYPSPGQTPNPQPGTLPGYQPPPPNQPLGQSGEYDFIMGPTQKKPGFSLNVGGGKGGLIALIGLGLAVIIVLLVGYNLLFGNKPSVTVELVDIAARQQEITRITAVNSTKLRDANLLAVNSVAKATVRSDQSQILGYLASFGVKPKPAELSTRLDKQTDTLLASAEQNGRLEDEYAAVLAKQLKAYQVSLKAVYDTTESPQTKQLLQTAFDNAQAVLSTQIIATAGQ